MRTPDLRPDHTSHTAGNANDAPGPLPDQPAAPDNPDGQERRPLSDYYRDDPNDIFPTNDDQADEPDHTPPDYTPEARTLARDLGFDPHTRTGPLADRHRPGVHDPIHWPPHEGRHPHELRSAQLLADEGADVRMGPEDHTQAGVTHVDSIVRYNRDDPGTLTELKAIVDARNIPGAIKTHVVKAVTQLDQHVTTDGRLLNGHVVVDGSARGLNETDVLRGCLRLVGQANAHCQKLPRQMRFILGDMTSRFFDPRTNIDNTGAVRFNRPDEKSFRTTRLSTTEDSDDHN